MATDDPTEQQQPTDLEVLWAFARAAQHAATIVAERDPGLDSDLRWTLAAGYLGEAADELQRIRPAIGYKAQTFELSAHMSELESTQVLALILTAITDQIRRFDLDDPDLSSGDLLVAGLAMHWLGMAHYELAGRLP